ncbi:cation diffusion facilitator family transporter [soil metagenome]
MSAGARHRGRLWAALAITATFLVVQAVTAVLTGSLALLSDTGHMATDVLGLGMALAAVEVSRRVGASGSRTFGVYRLEVLAATANSLLLFGVGGYALVEGIRRLGDPVEVPAVPLLVVAVLGLGANVVAFLLLRDGAKESLAVEGAYLEVLADLLGSVAVIVAAVVLLLTGWAWVDPVVGAAIGLVILPRAWRLGRKSVSVLLQSAPSGMDPERVHGDLAAIPDVVDVHDLHLWTLTSGLNVASAHVMVRSGTDPHRVLDIARDLLADTYGLDHATLQVEPEDHAGCADVTW